MRFCEKLKEARTKAGLKQEELAKALGVSLRTITNYESGECYPRKRDIHKTIILERIGAVGVDHRAEHGNDLILLLIRQRVEGDRPMLVPKALVLKLFKVSKHRAVGHMVSVDDKIV